MFTKVLIANRGEIACRIIRTLQRMNIQSVAVYSEADEHSLHVSMADQAVCVGPAPAAQSYLQSDKILEIAKELGVDAIHPGYGFLSENAEFAEACGAAGIVFIGPKPDHMRVFGLKHSARALAEANQVPLLSGSELLHSSEEAISVAQAVGYPVMLKSTAGGGGIGMRLCYDDQELLDSYESVKRLGQNNFSNSGIFIEKYVEEARHIEVQIFGDGLGNVLTLGERDCSVQRRNQKVIEETPAPDISENTRQKLYTAAKQLSEAVGYASAGTVEFIYDRKTEEFYFLEVNTRLQVEHGVTEEIYGVDLVEWMILQAAGELFSLPDYQAKVSGHSVQVRVYAEDPNNDFRPCSGLLTEFSLDAEARLETWVQSGSEVPPFYDPLIAKVITTAETREQALQKMSNALDQLSIAGIQSNRHYLAQIVKDEGFQTGGVTTKYLNNFDYHSNTIDVLHAGTMTTVQDFPGRVAYWDVGVPPSGPIDSLSFRLGNKLLGNNEEAAGLEMTFGGPTLQFNCAARICLTGAEMEVTLDGEAVPYWQTISVPAGGKLVIKQLTGSGKHAYLLIEGGLDVPQYLGSRSTFTLGKFGGHAGRALQIGDALVVQNNQIESNRQESRLAPNLIPQISNEWEIAVLYGPHGAPDFFLDEDIEMFFNTTWEVHYNSARTGIRLIGPKPKWARTDGGEAGLHPSNIHDNAYAIGAIDFTGDMPVILGPDGPSLGGFVCPATIIKAELWKAGQLTSGAKVKFKRVSRAVAKQMEDAYEACISTLEADQPCAQGILDSAQISTEGAILYESFLGDDDFDKIVYRQSGDDNILIEFGPLVLDLNLRFKVHALHQLLLKKNIDGVIDLTPGIRSLQVHFDSQKVLTADMLDLLITCQQELTEMEDIEVSTRIVHLPLSWDDGATRLAIEKYMQSVNPDAPWCPSNIEFIRRINGLDTIEEVKEIVFNANYLVMGLGDVYLGAPVATPLDPRHRLVTTKYNPARTWTPENAVGIGGAYMCVYGMEGPGGYQFVGRTVQMWNRYKQTENFKEGKPWLLRFFDQIKFYPVTEDELTQMRKDFVQGTFTLKVEEETFKLKDYQKFLSDNQESISAFKEKQQKAFNEERDRWEAAGQNFIEEELVVEESPSAEISLPENCHFIDNHVPGNVWKIEVECDQEVSEGENLVIVESMKMEIPVEAPGNGVIRKILCEEGKPIQPGQHMFIFEPAN